MTVEKKVIPVNKYLLSASLIKLYLNSFSCWLQHHILFSSFSSQYTFYNPLTSFFFVDACRHPVKYTITICMKNNHIEIKIKFRITVLNKNNMRLMIFG